MNTATDITARISDFVRESHLNLMPPDNETSIFDAPLVQFAAGEDPLFQEYKEIIGPEHLTPRQAMEKAFGITSAPLPPRFSVIAWILPITASTRESNRSETRLPSRQWSHTRWFGELFNNALREFVVDLLTREGFRAVAPMTAPFFTVSSNEKGMFSNWSERHIAYAAGLGTFSLSDGFITEKGIAHRCGSVVTDLALPASPRTAAGPFANCLTLAGKICGKCIERCPAGAISDQGHDKVTCGKYLGGIGYNPVKFKSGYDLATSIAGCGLCQTNVPCESCNPVR